MSGSTLVASCEENIHCVDGVILVNRMIAAEGVWLVAVNAIDAGVAMEDQGVSDGVHGGHVYPEKGEPCRFRLNRVETSQQANKVLRGVGFTVPCHILVLSGRQIEDQAVCEQKANRGVRLSNLGSK